MKRQAYFLGMSVAFACIFIGRPANAADAPAAGAAVSISIAIVEFAGEKGAAPVKLDGDGKMADRIAELEKQGKVESITRLRLATLDQLVATVQVGERVPVVTGRTRQPAGRDGGFNQATITFENIGTLVRATPRVEADGSVLVEFDLEKSRLIAIPAREDSPAGTMGLSRQVQIQSKSTVRIPKNQTVIVGGVQASGPDESRQHAIIVSAQVADAPAGDAKPAAAVKPEESLETRIYSLKYARAKDVAGVMTTLFDRMPLTVSVDERTNSIIARGDNERLSQVDALLQRLDQEQRK